MKLKFFDLSVIKKIDKRPRFEIFLLLVGIIVLTLTVAPEISSDGVIRYKVVAALLNGEQIPL